MYLEETLKLANYTKITFMISIKDLCINLTQGEICINKVIIDFYP